MTDDRPDDRRSEDLADKVDALLDRMDELDQVRASIGGNEALTQRIREHEQMMVTLPKIEADVDEMGTMLLGTKKSDLMGGGRMDDGLDTDVADIRKKVNGGGLSRSDQWKLRIAAASPIATVLAAWILTR